MLTVLQWGFGGVVVRLAFSTGRTGNENFFIYNQHARFFQNNSKALLMYSCLCVICSAYMHLQYVNVINFFRARWVTIHGVKYKVGAILHIGYTKQELLLFHKVEKIAVIDIILSGVRFIVAKVEIVGLNKHYQCYEVRTSAKPTIKSTLYGDFSCFLPLNELKAQGHSHRVTRNTKFICVRFDLEC